MAERKAIKLAKLVKKFQEFLAKDYKYLEMLSTSGGFSRVLKGMNIHLGREEALKVIDIDSVEETGLTMSKVEMEINILAKLDHKHVVKIYHTLKKLTEDDNYLFIIMELCESTVSKVIKSYPKGVPRELAMQYLRQITKGVAYLHTESIIHRDLKPDNLFLKHGQIKIGDFNISKEEGKGEATKPSQIMLTLSYSPPERVTGGKGSAKLDVWAIGCIYYELLEGKKAFDFESDYEEAIENIKSITYPPCTKATQFDLRILQATLVPEKQRKSIFELKEMLKEDLQLPVKSKSLYPEEVKAVIEDVGNAPTAVTGPGMGIVGGPPGGGAPPGGQAGHGVNAGIEGVGRGEVPGRGRGEVVGRGRGEIAGRGRGEVAGRGRGEVPGRGRGEVPGRGRGEVAGRGRGDQGRGRGEDQGRGRGGIVGNTPAVKKNPQVQKAMQGPPPKAMPPQAARPVPASKPAIRGAPRPNVPQPRVIPAGGRGGGVGRPSGGPKGPQGIIGAQISKPPPKNIQASPKAQTKYPPPAPRGHKDLAPPKK